LLGPPTTLSITSSFYFYKVDELSKSILPNAVVTNSDGFMGAGFSPARLAQFRTVAKTNKSILLQSAPLMTLPEGMRATIGDRRRMTLNGTNAMYG
jgi:hypothetical protein